MLLPLDGSLFILPPTLNWLVALLPPLVLVGLAVLPQDHPRVVAVLSIADYVQAFSLLQPLLIPYLRCNLRPPPHRHEAEDPGLHAARASTSLGVAACLLVLVVSLLGRTILLATTMLRLLVVFQAGCWGSTLVLRLQADGGLPYLPATLKKLLSARPLELIDAAKAFSATPRPPAAFPVSVGELVAGARALAPLILLPDDHREAALEVLPPRLLDALDQPLASHLPSWVQSMLGPWAHAEVLRLKKGLPPSCGGGVVGGDHDASRAAAHPHATRAPTPAGHAEPATDAMAVTGSAAAAASASAAAAAAAAAIGPASSAAVVAAIPLGADGGWTLTDAALASADISSASGSPTSEVDAPAQGAEGTVPLAAVGPTSVPPVGMDSHSQARDVRRRTSNGMRPERVAEAAASKAYARQGAPGAFARASALHAALAPELLVTRLVVRRITKVVSHQIRDTRSQVRALAAALVAQAVAVVCAPPRAACRVGMRVVGACVSASANAVDCAVAVLQTPRGAADTGMSQPPTPLLTPDGPATAQPMEGAPDASAARARQVAAALGAEAVGATALDPPERSGSRVAVAAFEAATTARMSTGGVGMAANGAPVMGTTAEAAEAGGGLRQRGARRAGAG